MDMSPLVGLSVIFSDGEDQWSPFAAVGAASAQAALAASGVHVFSMLHGCMSEQHDGSSSPPPSGSVASPVAAG